MLFVDDKGHYAQVDDCIFAGLEGVTGRGKYVHVYPNGSNHRNREFSREFATEQEAVDCLMENYPDMREATDEEYRAARDGMN